MAASFLCAQEPRRAPRKTSKNRTGAKNWGWKGRRPTAGSRLPRPRTHPAPVFSPVRRFSPRSLRVMLRGGAAAAAILGELGQDFCLFSIRFCEFLSICEKRSPSPGLAKGSWISAPARALSDRYTTASDGRTGESPCRTARCGTRDSASSFHFPPDCCAQTVSTSRTSCGIPHSSAGRKIDMAAWHTLPSK